MKKPLICPYCKKEAVWCENKEIYGKNYGNSYMCWLCKPCNAYVGCHNNGKKALGTLANAETREWRKKVHARIDPLWKTGKMSRGEVYKNLNRLFSKGFHTGEADIEMCKKVLEYYQEQPKFERPTLESIKRLVSYQKGTNY